MYVRVRLSSDTSFADISPFFQSRSFTNVSTAAFPDTSKNSTTNSLTSPWEKNIWAFNSGLGNGDTKTDASKLRDFGAHGSARQLTEDKKSGSGVLLEGSHPTNSTWGFRAESNNRSFSSNRYSDLAQTRPNATFGSQQPGISPTESISPTSARPPVINLTSNDFKSRMASSAFPGHESDPPTLYTKFNATAPPVDSPRASVSPTETRKSTWSMSAATSRDPSQPPSRHSNQEPAFPDPTPNTRFTPSSTRTHSLSSQRNANSFQNGVDQLLPQFGQMSLGQNGHAAALRKASEPWSGQMSQRTAQVASRFNSLPSNEKQNLEENDTLSLSYLASDDYGSTQPPAFPRFSTIQFGQSPATADFRPTQQFTTSGASPRAYDFPNGVKSQNEWPAYADEIALSRELGGLSEQQALLDPRVQHMLALRSAYPAALLTPYALPNGIQPGLPAPYLSMYPMGVTGLENGMSSREDFVSDGVQSTKLYDFKNAGKNNKRWELSDIFDHIAEFAGDQYGSRFIQTKLETANSDEKERVFREIEPNAIPLMQDVFGNYVIQKFFDHGHQDHKKMLANKMRGQVLCLSLQMYGCRVVQKALEHILVEQQAALVGELENHVLKCVKDQNGNHVIQKAIERCAPETIGFIYQAFLGQVQHLSLHPYGCRVIQRCLERPEWFPSKPRILSELHDSMQQGMIADQYGNYVVQHVVQKGSPMDKNHVFRIVLQGLEGYSKHKFASNVVEKCIEYSDDTWRRNVANELTAADQRRSEGDTTLVSMIKDNFGNYVIRESFHESLSFVNTDSPSQKSSSTSSATKTTSSSPAISPSQSPTPNATDAANKSPQ